MKVVTCRGRFGDDYYKVVDEGVTKFHANSEIECEQYIFAQEMKNNAPKYERRYNNYRYNNSRRYQNNRQNYKKED